MADAYIVDAVRSPIGRKNGALSKIRGDELGAQVLNGLVARHDLDPAEIEDVQMGCVTQIGEQAFGTLLRKNPEIQTKVLQALAERVPMDS